MLCNMYWMCETALNNFVLLDYIPERVFKKIQCQPPCVNKSQSRQVVHCIPETTDLVELFLASG